MLIWFYLFQLSASLVSIFNYTGPANHLQFCIAPVPLSFYGVFVLKKRNCNSVSNQQRFVCQVKLCRGLFHNFKLNGLQRVHLRDSNS